jgi:amidase
MRFYDWLNSETLSLMLRAVVPSRETIEELSRRENMHLVSSEIDGITLLFEDTMKAVNTVGMLSENLAVEPKNFQTRDPGYRPDSSEDPCNAFIRKIFVKGSGKGTLAGKRLGIKDNIAVAGIPMTNASDLGKDYVPDFDATVVTRLLDAGADIIGKLNLDNLSYSGTSETSIFGPVKNPINPEYSPGGSSSGSGAAVASGLVDIAIGVDQGGSARVPAYCCGIVAIKPTQGIVPTFGLTYMDHSFDHICPMAKNVGDVAATLGVIAGPDADDPQWTRNFLTRKIDYAKEMSKPFPENLRIGIIPESYSWEAMDPEIKECFLTSLDKLTSAGNFKTGNASMPLFQWSGAIWITIAIQSTHAMYDSSGDGYWHGGRYNPSWNEYIGKKRKEMSDKFPPLLKGSMLMGRYLREEYSSVFHSLAQNMRAKLFQEVEEALSAFDVLATPTAIVKPPKLKANITFEESLRHGVLLLNNTQAFNLTGHPAISIPCGIRGGFPVGLQLISKCLDESTLFQVASHFEKQFNWREQ